MKFVSPWIHTTEQCNLKCHYCYVGGKAIMTSDVYEALGRMLLETDTEHCHLRFAGGEPLLVFDKWKPFAERMLEHKAVTVEVLTNFRVPPKDFWKFAEREKVNVSVSVDNGKSVKQLDETIANRLSRLRNPWIMTTITTENVDSMEILATFIGTNSYGWAMTTDYFQKSDPEWKILSKMLSRVVNILKEFDYDFSKISFNNFSIKQNFSGCRAGDEMFAVACDGTIHKCQTQIGTLSKIGDVFKGYTRKTCPERTLCRACSIWGFCTGWCQLYYKPDVICNVIKTFANDVFSSIKEKADAK